MANDATHAVLARDTNQALGIANYAIEFLAEGAPDDSVLERTKLVSHRCPRCVG